MCQFVANCRHGFWSSYHVPPVVQPLGWTSGEPRKSTLGSVTPPRVGHRGNPVNPPEGAVTRWTCVGCFPRRGPYHSLLDAFLAPMTCTMFLNRSVTLLQLLVMVSCRLQWSPLVHRHVRRGQRRMQRLFVPPLDYKAPTAVAPASAYCQLLHPLLGAQAGD